MKKAEEENSGYSDDEYSVTDSNEDIDGNESEDTTSESEDTLDEYGFPNSSSKKEKFLFEDEYDSNPNQSEKLPIGSHTDSSLEEMDASDFEMEAKRKRESKKKRHSKHQLVSAQRKSKKKKKGMKINSKILRTIVLSHSPRQDESMLFEEGADDISKSADVTIEMKADKKHNHPHTQSQNGEKKPQSPISKKLDFGKFKFGKKNKDEKSKNGDGENKSS